MLDLALGTVGPSQSAPEGAGMTADFTHFGLAVDLDQLVLGDRLPQSVDKPSRVIETQAVAYPRGVPPEFRRLLDQMRLEP